MEIVYQHFAEIKLAWTVWLFGKKLKMFRQIFTSRTQPQIWSIRVVKQGALATTTGTATRTSSEIINSRYCNHFETISSFIIWLRCSSPSGVKPSREALNLGEKMKKFLPSADVLLKPQIWLFHAFVLRTTAKNENCTCRVCKAIVFAH